MTVSGLSYASKNEALPHNDVGLRYQNKMSVAHASFRSIGEPIAMAADNKRGEHHEPHR